MKRLSLLSAAALLGLTGCETMNQPISSSGFDPLLVPGGGTGQPTARAGFKAHDLVRAAMDNTAFYKKKPKDNADADRLLARGTGMKVIRASGSYLQVELDATGEVGYVPEVMVESAVAQPAAGLLPGTGEYQVYPPLPTDGQLPTDGSITPAPEPPGGPIPTVIDPARPTEIPKVPDVPETPPAVPTPEAPTTPEAAPAATPPAPPAKPPGFPDPVPPVQPTEGASEAASGTAE
jgi:hypothetical protein